MKKEITVKLSKTPQNFMYKDEVFAYLAMLEEGRLAELPENFYVYYVISLFADEVDNGGVEQYLGNSSGQTYPDLRVCAEHLAHEAITPFILELCDFIDAGGRDFEEYDERFFEIEDKHDFHKAALKYYRENFKVDKIKIPVIKEKESDTCAYFTVGEAGKCAELEDGLKAFLAVLAGFAAQSWSVYLYGYINDEYVIEAVSHEGNTDLRALMRSWAEDEARLKICDFFRELSVSSIEEGSVYKASISPSGFEKDEYKMKYAFSMRGYDTVNIPGMTMISLCRYSYKKSPERYREIKNYLESNYGAYPNIKKVVEAGFVPED
ncbi:MAG: hypothetical protein IJW21_01875 [Clostridia bacterium]|nr:hypothetical protein [Clostridia bacterium]